MLTVTHVVSENFCAWVARVAAACGRIAARDLRNAWRYWRNAAGRSEIYEILTQFPRADRER